MENIVEPFFDVLGNLCDPTKKFPIRKDILVGDSVIIIKGLKEIRGTFYNSSTRMSKCNNGEIYEKYAFIYLSTPHKFIIANRSHGVLYDTELELYKSKIILFEKYKGVENCIQIYF